MYASHHAAVGTALTVGGYIAAGPVGVLVGGALAFLLHDPMDRLGEAAFGRSFPPDRQTLIWEGLPFLAFILAAVLAGPLWWVLATGWIAATGMDLIDKARWFMGRPTVFRCHDRAPDVRLTLWQTKALAVLAAPVPFGLVAVIANAGAAGQLLATFAAICLGAVAGVAFMFWLLTRPGGGL